MVNKTFEIPLDLKRPSASYDVEVVEGDNGNIIKATLTDDGTAVDLDGCKVLAVFSRPDGETVQQDTNGHGITVGGTGNNVVTIDLYSSSFRPGTVACELQVYSGDRFATLATSAQFTFNCRRSILNDDTITATDKYPVLTQLIRDTTEATDAAEEAAELANAAAAAATDAISGMWYGTIEEFNALTEHAPGTIYLIREE